jgi:hypothetical protein
MHLLTPDRELKKLKSRFKELPKPVDPMEPVGHCLNSANCGPREVAFYHTTCLKYRCSDYKPRHTKNAKILEKVRTRIKG